MSLSSLRRNFFVQHLHIIYSKRKSVFGWLFILVPIFFSERIYLFSNRHLQPSYTMIKSVLGDIFSSCSCSAKFWKRAYLGTYLSENSGLFRFVSKQFCLFRLFRYRFETPKQPKKNFFWFHETNRNKRETDLVSVCFGSNRKNFFFVSRTPYAQPFQQ